MTQNEVFRRLKHRHDAEVQRLAAELLKNPNADVTRDVSRLESYAKLLVRMGSLRGPRHAVVLGILAVSLTLPAVLWLVPVTSTRVLVEVETTAVAMTLADSPVTFSGIPRDSGQLHLENVQELWADELLWPKMAIGPDEGAAWMEVHESPDPYSELVVSDAEIVISGNAPQLRVDTDNPTVNVYVSDAVVEGFVLVSGSGRMLAGGPDTSSILVDRTFERDESDQIDFVATASRVPMVVRFGDRSVWALDNFRVDALDFRHEVPTPAGEPMVVSAVMAGTISLPDTEQKVTLRPGDFVSLRGVKGRVLQLDMGKRVSLQFQGEVSHIEIGPSGFEKSLKPSLLTYFYFQEPLAIFAAAAFFLWTALLNFRNTLR